MKDRELAVPLHRRMATVIAVELVSSTAMGQFLDKSADLHSRGEVITEGFNPLTVVTDAGHVYSGRAVWTEGHEAGRGQFDLDRSGQQNAHHLWRVDS